MTIKILVAFIVEIDEMILSHTETQRSRITKTFFIKKEQYNITYMCNLKKIEQNSEYSKKKEKTGGLHYLVFIIRQQ